MGDTYSWIDTHQLIESIRKIRPPPLLDIFITLESKDPSYSLIKWPRPEELRIKSLGCLEDAARCEHSLEADLLFRFPSGLLSPKHLSSYQKGPSKTAQRP